MDVRTYGQLAHADNTWYLLTEPHVTIRVKRIFPRMSPNAQGVLMITDTLDVCRDLHWLLTRWPLTMTTADRAYLDGRVEKSIADEATVRAIRGGLRLTDEMYLQPAVEPRPYQVEAADVVLATGSNLVVHGLGLGKTFTGLLVLRAPAARPAMVATLGGVMPRQWVRQVNKFFPTLTAVIGPTGQVSDQKMQGLLDADVVVLPYSRLAKYQPFLQGHSRTTILDEVQELRHEGSMKYNAAAAIASEAAYRVGLTGTPVYGYSGEIFDIIQVHEPGVLGSKTEFTREWGGVSVGKNLSIAGSGPLGAYLREQALMEVKSRADVGMPIEEPEVIEFEVDVDEQIIDDARAAVTGLAQRILSKAGTQQERFAWEREMDWKMREATGVAKAPQVADLVRMLLESQEKVLLFGWHHAVYDLWTEKLADLRPVRFTGEETPKQKDFNLARFAASNGPRVCMMSLRAGAGIDGLQEHCSTLVFGELDWSPGIHTQCIGRLARDGQPDPVTAYLATTPYGSDPLMTEVLGMKTQQQQHLVGVKLSDQPTLSNGDRLQRLAQAVLDRGTISAGQLAFRFGEPA